MTAITVRWESDSETATIEFGRRMGLHLQPGDCLVLSGDLGAGKTRFVQGLALSLGLSSRDVSSPTFVLCHVYDGRHRLLHVDAYRLRSPLEFEELGLLEQVASGAILVVEWGEKIAPALPAATIVVSFQELSPTTRLIDVEIPAARCELAPLLQT